MPTHELVQAAELADDFKPGPQPQMESIAEQDVGTCVPYLDWGE